MEINILVFGQIADITGGGSITIADIEDTDALKKTINQQFPAIQSLEYAIAINKKIVRTNSTIQPADIVALLPPFSGG